MSKTDFFNRSLTVFVGQGASSADVKGVCKRLESVTFSVQAASLQALCDHTLAPQLCDLVGRISDVRKNLVRVLTERW